MQQNRVIFNKELAYEAINSAWVRMTSMGWHNDELFNEFKMQKGHNMTWREYAEEMVEILVDVHGMEVYVIRNLIYDEYEGSVSGDMLNMATIEYYRLKNKYQKELYLDEVF